ncbi:hypothetical protein ACB092_06G222000 [Castanea dentata]
MVTIGLELPPSPVSVRGQAVRRWKLLVWIWRMGLKFPPLIYFWSFLFCSSTMNFLIWNCRGALKPAFQNYIHKLTQRHDLAIFVIMEAKLGGIRAKEITDRLPFDGVIHTETIGLSCGLWLLWNTDIVLVEELAKTEQEIHVEEKMRASNLSWIISAIYASPRSEKRGILWNNLSKVAKLHNKPWVMAGDFNEPLIDEDKFGGKGVNVNRSPAFKDCLDDCNMIDMGFTGPRYIWTNKRDISNLILERIDRFFMNPDWCVLYWDAKVTHLPHCHYDHCIVLMEALPARHTGVRKHDFDFVLDKVKKKLAGWKANLLSIAGRLVFIHASSSTIPNYVMQQASLLDKILKGIDRVNRNFLWGSSDHLRKMHWVKWDVVTKPKEMGSLGLQSAKGRNTTLLAKLNWRLHKEKDAHLAKSNLGPIRAHIQGPLPQDLTNLKLKDVISLGRWDWSKIPFNIPLEIRDVIQAIPIPLIARNNDKLAWKFSPRGSFDMRSAYLIVKNLVEAGTFAGSWIWKLQTLPRIQIFIWRCIHESIAVKKVLAKRGIPLDTTCSMCQAASESLTHALRDCTLVKPIWQKLGTNYWLISNSSLKSSQNAAGIPWNFLFPFAMWMIWKQRNQAIFANKRANLFLPKVITMQAKEFIFYALKTIRNLGWVKLNTDGSSRGSAGAAAGGGLIRDEVGNWVIGFSRRIGRADSFVAEIWALRDGLQLCHQMNIHVVMIELDVKALVDVLNSPSYCNLMISPLLDDCIILISQIPQVRVKYIYREPNRCADCLANLGLCQSLDFIVHSNPPLELISLVEADSMGSCCNRLCPVFPSFS